MEHIRLSNLYFSYERDGEPALSGIDFAVERGETLGIAGANGCGKSTLLQIIAGALKPARGNVMFNGRAVEAGGRAQSTGMVFQEPDYQLFMPSVWEDVAFGILKKGMAADEARTAALRALGMVEAEHLAQKPPYKLSGGEKQRAALAGVLISEPEALILDEPSAALDPRARKNLIALLKTITKTKIIASHDLDLLLALSQRVLFLHRGTIAAQSSVPGLLRNEVFLQSIGLELPLSRIE